MTWARFFVPLLLAVSWVSNARAGGPDDDPNAMAGRITAAGDAAKHDADVVVVVDWKDVRVRPSGIGTARQHTVTKILRDAGIRSQAVQRFPFDPHTNRLDLVVVRVYRADGKIEEIPIADPVCQPQTAWGIFWPTDQYLINVPRLAVGDAVETIAEMTGFNVAYLQADDPAQAGAAAPPQTELNAYGKPLEPPVPGNWHDEADFWSSVPIIEKRYSVRLAKSKPLQFEVYNGALETGVLLDGDELVYTFKKRDIQPLKSEPRMEPWPNVATKLLLATLPTWEDKSRWLYQVSEPQFAPDDDIRAAVAQITAGLKTDAEKYTALNHWVAENIRYAGTSRGMCEGYTIHPSVQTFRDRCGVCKDKAGMLVTMLRCAGFDSFLVMTMARQRVDRVPADQFNHAVTCIRWPDGQLLLLDPTWMPKSRDNWSKLEPLQHVVYGLPDGKELSQSSYFPPEDNEANWKAESHLSADNRLTGQLDFHAVGAPEGRLRRVLAATPPEERGDIFDRTFQRISPLARPANVQCTDPVDFSGPITFRSDYAAPDYALGDGPRRYLTLPMLHTVFGDRTLYDLFGDQTDAEKRQYGIALLATRLASIEETLTLPEGWTPTDLPKPVDLDGPSAALKFAIEAEPGKLHYTCKLTIKHGLIPADEYANYREVVRKFEELSKHVIACELEGGRAQS